MQRLISQLVKEYERCDQVCLAQHGVTASQGYTLLVIPETGSMTMNELSEAMGLANSTMTRMVDNLVRKGLIYRKPDDDDRRVVRVSLAAQGLSTRRTMEKAQQELLQGALADIQEDERTGMIHALERVNKAMEKALRACCNG